MNQDNNSNNRSGNGIPDIFNMPLGGNNDNTKSSGQPNPVPPVRPVAPQPAGNPGMMGQPSGQPNPVPPVRPVSSTTTYSKPAITDVTFFPLNLNSPIVV